MGRKSLADLERNPRDVTSADLVRVFLEAGWTVRGGTKHGFVAVSLRARKAFSFPRPHGRRMDDVYVRKAVKVIKEESGT